MNKSVKAGTAWPTAIYKRPLCAHNWLFRYGNYIPESRREADFWCGWEPLGRDRHARNDNVYFWIERLRGIETVGRSTLLRTRVSESRPARIF